MLADKLIFAAALAILLGFAGAAWAGCTTQTVLMPDGSLVVCSVCCDQAGNCTTICV